MSLALVVLAIAIEQRTDATTVGMPQDDDVIHSQIADRVFQCSAGAVKAAGGLIGRDQVGHIAHHEQIARC